MHVNALQNDFSLKLVDIFSIKIIIFIYTEVKSWGFLPS